MLQKILIVDDEPEFVELVSWVLAKEGYSVQTATSSLEGLNRARQIMPDLILLDLILPELDGTAVSEILRQLPSTASIPILMLSGCATPEARLIAMNAGVNDYLTKPFSPKQLVAKVGEILANDLRLAESRALDDTRW
jgi:DNA-binding response OmpR family regulator